MSAADGHVIGSPTKLLDNGPDEARLVIVLVAEGFRDSEQAAFNAACAAFVESALQEPFFGALMGIFNVYRVNVASDEPGVDFPTECGGTGATPRTFFDASLCAGGVARAFDIDEQLVLDTVNGLIPDTSWIAVIANTTEDAGSAGAVAVVGIGPTNDSVMLHELGHLFGLADEYDYLDTCDDDHGQAPDEEPAEPNVTTAQTREDLPWAYLVRPETPIPTMLNPDCSHCDERPNELIDDFEPGLFEGAHTYHCGSFRGSYACKMRDSTRPFCRVCVDALHDFFRPLLDIVLPSVLTTDLNAVNFGTVPVNAAATTRSFRLINVGSQDVVGIQVQSDDPNLTMEVEGGIDTLEPGGFVRIDLTLQPIAVEGERTPTVVIASSAPTVTVEVTVDICQPRPLLTLSGASDFGSVAAGLTIYGVLTVSNVGGVCSAPATIIVRPLVGPFRLAPGTPTSFVLPVAPEGEESSRRIFVEYTAPLEGGPPAEGQVEIEVAEEPGTTYLKSLSATPVAPEPVNAVLVVDRSGSMAEATADTDQAKIDHAIAAADLFVTLLREIDSIGVIRFNNHASDALGDLLLPLTPVADGREDARAVLSIQSLLPSGNTSIGAGMLLGSGVVGAATTDARALIVLTDGRQNRDPNIETAQGEILLQTPPQRVFAVGLGLNQLEDALHEIATATHGVAQITGPLEGDGEFLLQKLYVQILSDLAREAFIEDPVFHLPPGGRRRVPIGVSSADLSLDVVIAFRRGRAFPAGLAVRLVSPNGTQITLAEIAAGTIANMTATVRPTHVVLRILLPAFPGQQTAHVGTWQVELANNATGRTWLHGAVMAKGRSNLLLDGSLFQTGSSPGSAFTLVLEPTRFGQPTAAAGSVVARVRRPDGVGRTVACRPTEHGTYIGRFDDTLQPGHYRVEAELAFAEPGRRRHLVKRYRHLTGVVVAPKRGTGR